MKLTNHSIFVDIEYDNFEQFKAKIDDSTFYEDSNTIHPGNQKLSLLNYAAQHGRFEMVKYLLENGANLHYRSKLGENTLFYACQERDFKTVQYLIQKGAEVNVCDAMNTTPLNWVCEFGSDEIAIFLITHNADVNMGNKYGKPIHKAIKKNRLEVVKYLIKYGAELNVYDDEGKTPLDIAREKHNMDIIKFIENSLDS